PAPTVRSGVGRRAVLGSSGRHAVTEYPAAWFVSIETFASTSWPTSDDNGRSIAINACSANRPACSSCALRAISIRGEQQPRVPAPLDDSQGRQDAHILASGAFGAPRQQGASADCRAA